VPLTIEYRWVDLQEDAFADPTVVTRTILRGVMIAKAEMDVPVRATPRIFVVAQLVATGRGNCDTGVSQGAK